MSSISGTVSGSHSDFTLISINESTQLIEQTTIAINNAFSFTYVDNEHRTILCKDNTDSTKPYQVLGRITPG